MRKLFLVSIFGNLYTNLATMYERCEGGEKLCYLVKIRKIFVEVFSLAETEAVHSPILM